MVGISLGDYGSMPIRSLTAPLIRCWGKGDRRNYGGLIGNASVPF